LESSSDSRKAISTSGQMNWRLKETIKKEGNNMSKKILIVDDDKKATESVGAFLKAIGHEMLLATDGKEALDIIRREKLALVLLDIQMPGINGIQILETLRQKFKDTKVFIITAYAKDVKWKCDELGYDQFFSKPIELDPLLEGIKEIISKEKKEEKKEEPLKGIPKARVLFVEPNINVYGYACGMFDSKEFNPGEYETKVAYSLQEAMEIYGSNSLYGFSPDVVVLFDFNVPYEDIEKFAEYIMATSFKPKKIIIHGILPRPDIEIARLEKEGIVYCNQNVFTEDELRKMNQRLIDTVARECIKLDLVKKNSQ